MAIAGVSNTTTLADSLMTEYIEAGIRLAVSNTYLYRDFVYILPQTLVGTKRWSIPIYARFTAAASYTESDLVTAQAVTPTAVDIDSALFATAAFMSDWSSALVPQSVMAATKNLIDAVDRKLETDALGLASSMTNTQGSSATTNDVDNFVSVTSAFRALGKNSREIPTMVMSESAKRDLVADSMASGASIFSSAIGEQLGNALSSTNQGVWAQWGGVRFASSDLVPTVNSGKGNFLAHFGSPDEAALGMCFSMEPSFKIGEKVENVGKYLVTSMAHGVGIIEQARVLRFITKA
jgi:hypothetical protein